MKVSIRKKDDKVFFSKASQLLKCKNQYFFSKFQGKYIFGQHFIDKEKVLTKTAHWRVGNFLTLTALPISIYLMLQYSNFHLKWDISSPFGWREEKDSFFTKETVMLMQNSFHRIFRSFPCFQKMKIFNSPCGNQIDWMSARLPKHTW